MNKFDMNEARACYQKAVKLGMREHRHSAASDAGGYVQVLDEILPEINTVRQQSVGLMEIPIDLVVGTKTAGRQYAFSPGFLPILEAETEFGSKWMHLCAAHMSDVGITDPIRCFEYYGKFYVQEGNKRVSVLRYFDATTVSAYVTRLIPADNGSAEHALYQEFLEFFRVAPLYQVQFSLPGSYRKLLAELGRNPNEVWTEAQRQSFLSGFIRFQEGVRGQLYLHDLTVSDALLVFLRYYDFDALREMDAVELQNAISALQSDINALSQPNPVAVSAEPAAETKDSALHELFTFKSKKLTVAFIHERDAQVSVWTRAHELGRAHVDSVFPRQVETRAYFGAVPGENAEQLMEQAIRDGANVIFSTTPPLVAATLRVAARHPSVKLLNCSVDMPYPDIRTYYGRVYEGKFITGAIAAAMSRDGQIGYVGSYPIYGVPASINAFALGAKMVNPNAQIHLEWSCVRGDFIDTFRKRGIKIISNRDAPTPQQRLTEYGTFLMDESGSFWPLASPIWNWGTLYERVIRSILDGSWNLERADARAVNYWWGMSSGVIDVVLDDCLPEGVRLLAQILRREIQSGQLSPFDRSFSTQDGRLINDGGKKLTLDEILHMDYLCSCVSGSIPAYDEILPMAKTMVRLQGVYRDQLPPEKEDLI